MSTATRLRTFHQAAWNEPLLHEQSVPGTRGFDAAIPYYLNLAPNYDATLVPRIMTKRGELAKLIAWYSR